MEQPGLGRELLKTNASSGWRVAPPDVRDPLRFIPPQLPFVLPHSFGFGYGVAMIVDTYTHTSTDV